MKSFTRIFLLAIIFTITSKIDKEQEFYFNNSSSKDQIDQPTTSDQTKGSGIASITP